MDQAKQDIARLLERTANMADDLTEIKGLVREQNGRVRTLETQVVEIKTYRKVVVAIGAAIGSAITFLGNLLLPKLLPH
jgi:hypothetical protein